jgi:hypothetical protein
VAHVHAVVFGPLNISLPTPKLLQIGSAKVTNKILRLNFENHFSLNQTFLSASAAGKNRKKREMFYSPEAKNV